MIIFGWKMMVKSGIDFFILKLNEPLQIHDIFPFSTTWFLFVQSEIEIMIPSRYCQKDTQKRTWSQFFYFGKSWNGKICPFGNVKKNSIWFFLPFKFPPSTFISYLLSKERDKHRQKVSKRQKIFGDGYFFPFQILS